MNYLPGNRFVFHWQRLANFEVLRGGDVVCFTNPPFPGQCDGSMGLAGIRIGHSAGKRMDQIAKLHHPGHILSAWRRLLMSDTEADTWSGPAKPAPSKTRRIYRPSIYAEELPLP